MHVIDVGQTGRKGNGSKNPEWDKYTAVAEEEKKIG
jgi:hypothetical protein